METLASFAVHVIQRSHPKHLLGYLRQFSATGDPGTMLHSQLRNEIGRDAKTWQDITSTTEAAISGPFEAEVARLVGGTAAILSVRGDEHREKMRVELRRLLAIDRQEGAGRLLRAEFHDEPDEADLHDFVAGICTVATALEAWAS